MQALPAAWAACWIEPVERTDQRVQRPVHHLATEFVLEAPVMSAVLWITAHGVYEAFLNGSRVGDEELTPGFTAYRKRLQVQAFEVSSHLLQGANALGAMLSDGWWRSQHSSHRGTDSYGASTALLAQLEITLSSGERVVVATGGDWRSTPSHVLAADLIAGEVHDLARRVPGWAEAGTDRSGWDVVTTAAHPMDVLIPMTGPPIRRVDTLPARSVIELRPGVQIVDFGQNSNGWIRLEDLGPAGTELQLVYGEALASDGDVTQDGISHSEQFPDRVFQTDIVRSVGDDTVFEPRHSTKGFRYVRIEGLTRPLDPRRVSSVVVHSDLRRIGSFHCSNERLNRLHEAGVWSFRSNACGVPTDCPTRERAAWTGDYQTFIRTAAYLYDVHDFTARWLEDLAAEQWDDGCVLNMVPDPHVWDRPDSARWRGAQGSAGWGDAACHVPWELYLATGDDALLARHLDTMRRWVDFGLRRAREGRHPERAAARPEPAPHEAFLLDSGFHFGEWTEPSRQSAAVMFQRILAMDHGPTATAFLYRSASQLSAAAAVVGNGAVAAEYSEHAERVRSAWCTEFVSAHGHVQPQDQATLVRALAFGLLPSELRNQAVQDLVALISAAGDHLGTGFLASPFLLPVLADNGRLDVAYRLLMQDSEPSWLAMVNAGATTLWENWFSDNGRVTSSLNHYSKGSVLTFLHQYVAGLQVLQPGYRRFQVAPRPAPDVSAAATTHISPHGKISTAWQVDADLGVVEVDVPPGTTAELVLPNGERAELTPGLHRASWVP